MTDCIFCKIVKKEIPASIIWESETHLAFLDVFPNTKGMSLVIPKHHFDSYAVDMPESDFTSLYAAARTVAKKLDLSLGTKRTALVLEGMGINHAHVKLYPLHGLKDSWKPTESKENVFHPTYPGFITTKMGPKADVEELEKLAEKIRNE